VIAVGVAQNSPNAVRFAWEQTSGDEAAWLGLEPGSCRLVVAEWSRRPGETVKLSSTSDPAIATWTFLHFAPPELPEVPVGEFH